MAEYERVYVLYGSKVLYDKDLILKAYEIGLGVYCYTGRGQREGLFDQHPEFCDGTDISKYMFVGQKCRSEYPTCGGKDHFNYDIDCRVNDLLKSIGVNECPTVYVFT